MALSQLNNKRLKLNNSLVEDSPDSKPSKQEQELKSTNFGISNTDNHIKVKQSHTLLELLKEALSLSQRNQISSIIQQIKLKKAIDIFLMPL
jgi:hypothetical protein